MSVGGYEWMDVGCFQCTVVLLVVDDVAVVVVDDGSGDDDDDDGKGRNDVVCFVVTIAIELLNDDGVVPCRHV